MRLDPRTCGDTEPPPDDFGFGCTLLVWSASVTPPPASTGVLINNADPLLATVLAVSNICAAGIGQDFHDAWLTRIGPGQFPGGAVALRRVGGSQGISFAVAAPLVDNGTWTAIPVSDAQVLPPWPFTDGELLEVCNNIG